MFVTVASRLSSHPFCAISLQTWPPVSLAGIELESLSETAGSQQILAHHLQNHNKKQLRAPYVSLCKMLSFLPSGRKQPSKSTVWAAAACVCGIKALQPTLQLQGRVRIDVLGLRPTVTATVGEMGKCNELSANGGPSKVWQGTSEKDKQKGYGTW